MSDIDKALKAREAARKRSPHDPLIYAAWRYVTSCEQDLSVDEYATYRSTLDKEAADGE